MGIGRRRGRRRGLIVGAAVGSHRANKRNAAEEQQAVNEAPQMESSESAIDPADELKKLADLKDQGIITQEEFDQKKKELLGL